MIKSFYKLLFSLLIIGSCKKEISLVSTDFTTENEFTAGIEGPAVDNNGNLYAVNYKEEGTIGIVDKKGNASLFVTLPNGSIGNGIRFDQNNNMFIADYVSHNILMIKNGEKKVQIFASDSTLNQPNDLAISPNGTLYASDPNWANETGKLWMVKNNTFILLEADMGTTNGIEVAPDGKTLYANESVQRRIWKYSISKNGRLKNKTLFTSFTNFGLDGMRCDSKGNLYVCRYGKGTVAIFNPNGTLLREIQLKGKKPTNISFGGGENKQCFVTVADRGIIETFFAEYPGRSF
ncbi:MAG: SMP-30/gluconolactonase/LRE family protein [Flavobacteriaceae bacterium]|nr:SMP-30/gluconolactonase/LRE family protein [Flavobacteriaceae bacterium]